jgi:hypothetical protein
MISGLLIAVGAKIAIWLIYAVGYALAIADTLAGILIELATYLSKSILVVAGLVFLERVLRRKLFK